MKTIIFFIAVTFGVSEVAAGLVEETDHCYETSAYDNMFQCFDNEALLACLRKIDPADDEEESKLNEEIANTITEIRSCRPSRYECIAYEINKCMYKYDAKKFDDVKNVCDKEVYAAKDCLVKLNTACGKRRYQGTIEYLDKDIALCKSGYYDDGPCSAVAIENCTAVVYSDVKDILSIDYVFGYNCRPSDVIPARQCLANIETNCKNLTLEEKVKLKLKKGLKLQLDELNYYCPPIGTTTTSP